MRDERREMKVTKGRKEGRRGGGRGQTGFFGSFGVKDILLKVVALAWIWPSILANDAAEREERRGTEAKNAERVAALTTVVIILLLSSSLSSL